MTMQVKIVSPSGLANDTKVLLPDGSELQGITRIDFKPIVPGAFVECRIEIQAFSLDASAAATMLIAHPRTGKLEPVKRIEFEGGDIFDFAEMAEERK